MAESVKRINSLLGLMKSGNMLYRQAQQRIDDQDLQAFFAANLRDRQRITEQLRSMLGRDATDDEDLGPEARLRINRADLLAAIKDNEAAVYIQQLAGLEMETNRAFCAARAAASGSELDPRLQNLNMEFDRLLDRSRAAKSVAGERESPTTLSTRMMR